MADQKPNKITVQAEVEPGPDATETLQLAAPTAWPTPAITGTLPPHLPESAGTLAPSFWAPFANPFGYFATPPPPPPSLEPELRDLAARNPGVQLKEMHQVHLRTPKPTSSTAQPPGWQQNPGRVKAADRAGGAVTGCQQAASRGADVHQVQH